MAKPNTNKTVLTTGVVEARYPYLNETDSKFGAPVYKITAVFPDEASAASMVETINKAQEAAIELAVKEQAEKAKKAGKKFNEEKFRSSVKTAALPIKAEEDEDGDETGRIFIGPFKMKAEGKTRDGKEWERSCPVFDAAGNPIDLNKVSIWGGSMVDIAFTAEPFYTPALGAGCSLRLEAVQVKELCSGGTGAKSAAGFGFGTDGPAMTQPGDDSEEESGGEEYNPDEDCPF